MFLSGEDKIETSAIIGEVVQLTHAQAISYMQGGTA